MDGISLMQSIRRERQLMRLPLLTWLLALFLASNVARGQDVGTYTKAACISGQVITFDVAEGSFVIRAWNGASSRFVSLPLKTDERIDGFVRDIDVPSAEKVTLLVGRPGRYSVWEYLSNPARITRVWAGEISDDLRYLHCLAPAKWVVSGQRQIYLIDHGQVCQFVENPDLATSSAVRDGIVAIGGYLKTYGIPRGDCRPSRPLSTLDFRGYTLTIAPRSQGWIAIARQAGMSRLLLLNEELAPLSAVGLADGVPWTLTPFHDAVVASAPLRHAAYEVRGNTITRLHLRSPVNGYVCRSFTAAPLRFTDGERVVDVVATEVVTPHRVHLIFGVFVETRTLFVICVAVALLVVIVPTSRRRWRR